MKKTLEEVVAAAEAAIRVPKSALDIHRLASDPECKLSDLIVAVETDPAFSVWLLRLANSSVFSRGIDIPNLEQAITRVGNAEVAELALGLAAAEQFSLLESELMRATSFLNHSLTTAVLARAILARCGQPSGSVFCAGLLHDLGLLALFFTSTEIMKDVLDYSLELDQEDLVSAEQSMLGYDHTIVGEKIALNWGLPKSITQAIRYHHEPSQASEHQAVVASVALANALEGVGLSEDETLVIDSPVYEQVDSIIKLDRIKGNELELLEAAQLETTELLFAF